MTKIHRSQITNEKWYDTSFLRMDEKQEFREKKQYGNRHVVFNPGAVWGTIHYDKYNATDFPVGTIQHTSKYTEEKTGIPEGLVTLGIVAVSLFVGYKALKFISKKIQD